MKKLFTTMMLMAVCCLMGCDNEDNPAVQRQMEMVSTGLVGTWELSEIDGLPQGLMSCSPGEVLIRFIKNGLIVVRVSETSHNSDWINGLFYTSLDLERSKIYISDMAYYDYYIEGETLFLSLGASRKFVFHRISQDALPDAVSFDVWRLSGFGSSESAEIQPVQPQRQPDYSSIPLETCYTVAFCKDGTLLGRSYANMIFGTYQMENGLLEINCGHSMVGEGYDGPKFIDALGACQQYEQPTADELRLYYNDQKDFLLFYKQ